MDLLDLCLTFVGSGKMVQDIIGNTWRLSQDPAHWPSIFIRRCVCPDVFKQHGAFEDLGVYLAVP